ncbi:MAG TPA: peptidoglycan DD-metalloendopeptidase family protein [Steroidobacteraceae bacterium]|nr:peptidoglycan DD-metalloendopeptidase family protein [Steroidobacteraceae bacterium]
MRRHAYVCLLLLPGLGLVAGAALAASQGQTESQLKAVREQIQKITQQIGRDAVEQDRVAQQLRNAELSLAATRAELARLRGQAQERTARRDQLAAERDREQQALVKERASLAGEVRAAYFIGREEPLRLLLNQQDPQHYGRMLAYYGYFGRARAAQIDSIHERLARIATLDTGLAGEQQQLTVLLQSQQSELAKLEQARGDRKQALGRLQQESQSRTASLNRFRSQQAALEKLLQELRRRLSTAPLDNNTAFGRLRGQLNWPVEGRTSARFGEKRAGDVRWDGMVIVAERDTPVKAIAAGRVVYADWLPGLGLLVIVDHGEGYLSLYGYNSQIFKKPGDSVARGEVLAGVGDTGGQSQPELYFEIRRAGKPVDPAGWFRRPNPG